MKVLELLILTISLKITAVISSGVWENQNVICHKLCCNMNQTYNEALKWCLDLPEYVKSDWLAVISRLTKAENVSIIEYGNCSLSPEPSVIDECYSPKHSYDWEDLRYQKYSNVSCDRLKFMEEGGKHRAVLTGLILLLMSTIVFLPILILCTCTKKEKKNELSYKLITWYLTSMIATNLTLVLAIIGFSTTSLGTLTPYSFILLKFFATSTFFWLNSIGYNAYVQFKEANVKSTKRKDRMRFIWYSIFVWLGTVVILCLHEMVASIPKNVFTTITARLIGFLNVFAFLVLALKICVIRCGVIGISTEKHIKCKLARLICRLGILMGIPRMLWLSLRSVIGIIPCFILYVLEPYWVYLTFISENENCCTLFCCKCCCCCPNRKKENDRPTQTITMKNPNTV